MKSSIKIIITVQILLFSFNQILFAFPNISSTSQNPVIKDNYSEHFKQGENFNLQGNYEKSIQSFKKALSLIRNNNNEKNRIESLIKLGILYWNTGKLDISLTFYTEALSSAEKAELIEKKELVLNFIQIYNLYKAGKDCRNKGKHQESIEIFKNAIALAKELKSEEFEVKCLRQLSVTHLELNDTDKFFSLNKEALRIARKLNHKREEGMCLSNIGLYYDGIENYSQALRHYEEALRIARILGDLDDESWCLTNISLIYNGVGNYEKALEYQKKVLTIDKQQLKVEAYVAIDLNNIGITYQKKALHSGNREDLFKALPYFKESLKIARKIKDVKTEIQALTNMGMVHIDLEGYPEALRYSLLGLKKAEKIQDQEESANLLVNIGIIYSKQEHYDRAIEYFRKAIDTASSINGDKILWEAHLEIADAYRKQNNYKKSLESYKRSVSHLEKIRSKIQLEELKASYLGTDKRIDTYYNLIDSLIKLNQLEPEKRFHSEAFFYMEKARARAFLDRLEVSQVNISHGVDAALLNQEEDLMKEISNLNIKLIKPGLSTDQKKNIDDQIRRCEEQLESLKREIRISSPAYAGIKDPQIISLEQTQKQLLDNKTAFFEYSLGKRSSYAFVITKRKLKIFPLPPAKIIQTQVKQYLKALTDKENRDFKLGYELFSTLIFPGLEEKIDTLIFIPDDILHYLPFETLLSQKNTQRWLIKDYEIAYAPSISSLHEIIQREQLNGFKPQKDFLAFGDPFFGSNEDEGNGENNLKYSSATDTFTFLRLKYSGLEIEKIAALFKKPKINIFKREKATEEQLKKLNLTDYNIIHFATHSIIDDKKPARSSIVLSIDETSVEDGLLQMREIFNLKLNAALVTLSACQTGLGQFIKGEGIEGLSRAFFYAGASSVLISLWPVHDQASSQFMERFYSHLRSSNSIINSLRKTKLEMIGSDVLSHPYYWAGFVVTGHSDKIIYPSTRETFFFLIFILLLIGGIGLILKMRSKSSSPKS